MYRVAAPAEGVIKEKPPSACCSLLATVLKRNLLANNSNISACHVCWALVCDGDSGLDGDSEDLQARRLNNTTC
jgi:hypothetical protein